MRKIDRRNELAELNDDATEGQMADYFAAELSGENGAWNMGIVEYMCPRCGAVVQTINDALRSFNPLIAGWHEKAGEGDCFSRFVFEYLSLAAHLKNNLFYDVNSDRAAIQALKRDQRIRQEYLRNIEATPDIRVVWSEIIEELERRPLHNSSFDPDNPEIDRWWNTAEDAPNREDERPKGRVLSLDDWPNMVEFWYSVRNNLFHGGKDPNIERDVFLVEHAYITLRQLMNDEIASLIRPPHVGW